MYIVDLYRRVRRAHFVEGMSIREAARVFDLHRSTVNKMLEYPVPPGYRGHQPPRRPKLDPYKGVIDRILKDDQSLPKKQRTPAEVFNGDLAPSDERSINGKWTPSRALADPGKMAGLSLNFAPNLSN